LLKNNGYFWLEFTEKVLRIPGDLDYTHQKIEGYLMYKRRYHTYWPRWATFILGIFMALSLLISNTFQAVAQPNDNQWEKITLPSSNYSPIVVDPSDTRIIYYSYQDRIYKSQDAGDTLNLIYQTPGESGVRVYLTKADPLRIYAGGFSKLYRSDNGGQTWQLVWINTDGCQNFIISQSDQNKLFAYSCNHSNINLSAVDESTDGGQTWSALNGPFTTPVEYFGISPTDHNNLLATSNQTIYHSNDGGNNWETFNFEGYSPWGDYVFSPVDSRIVYTSEGSLRSQDGGHTWQRAVTGTYISGILPSSSESNQVLLCDYYVNALFTMFSNGKKWEMHLWRKSPADVPQWVGGGFSPGEVTYLYTQKDLWRFVNPPQGLPYGSNTTFLPIVSSQSPLNLPAQKALDRVNYYRKVVGVFPLALNPNANQSAQNHANYFRLNQTDPSALPDPHTEVEGKPGFTGEQVGDRLAYVGFGKDSMLPMGTSGEVMSGWDSPNESVDSYMNTVYHRYSILSRNYTLMGYGSILADYQNSFGGISVIDMVNSIVYQGDWIEPTLPKIVVYPISGQIDVPTSWNGSECPNPLPPGAKTPTGYPITIQADDEIIISNLSEVHDNQGHLIDVYQITSWTGNFGLIPVQPLQPNMTYTVHVAGNLDVAQVMTPFDMSWSFTTGN
jgi:uncharacterized protein YkwD/photosystem II stability/assembly factor-like uncharacterized protein